MSSTIPTIPRHPMPVATPPMTDAEKQSVLKMQAFVRGALCRARVSLMVKDLIDELLAQKYGRRPGAGGLDEGSMHSLKAGATNGNKSKPGEEGHRSVTDLRDSIEARTDHSRPPPSPQQSPKPSALSSSSHHTATNSPLRRKLSSDPKLQHNATRHVSSSQEVLSSYEARLDEEMQQLLKDIRRLGSEPGEPHVTFGELFDDEQVANYYEALVGTLKGAKKKGLITYEGQVLLKGISDEVVITIVNAK